MNPQIKESDIPDGWSKDVVDLVNRLICRKEENRLGKQGAQSVKSHPWFKDIEWEELENHRIKAPFIPINVSLLFITRLKIILMKLILSLLKKTKNY